MIIRLSKILCVLAVSFYCLLTVFGNATDYFTNFPAVERALTMKDIFPNANITYRAITNSLLHHTAYITIIGLEVLTTLLCAFGAWKLFRARPKVLQFLITAKIGRWPVLPWVFSPGMYFLCL